MIVLCSVSDKSAYRGTVYATTMKPIGTLPLIECLRPTQELVYGIKYRGQSDEWYTSGYRALLVERWTAVSAWLASLHAEDDLTLLCYCRAGAFCHRHLIARLVAQYRPDVEVCVR